MDTTGHAVQVPPQGRVVPTNQSNDDLSQDDFGPSVEACVWTLAVLAAGWLALRLYYKWRKHRGLWWDDHFLTISWVFIVFANSATSAAISFGWGKPLGNAIPPNGPEILLALFISGLFSLSAAACSKTSFALTLLRISNGWVKAMVWFAIITINVAMGLSGIFNFVSCTPVQKVFNFSIPGTCWPKSTLIGYNSFTAAYSGLMDIILALLPCKIIMNMNMSRKDRLGAIFAMSLGIFAGIISLGKIYALTGTIQANINSSVQLSVLSIAESAVTIMAASIPILRALSRDKAGPGDVKLFTLNPTQHVTIRRDAESQSDTDDAEGEGGKNGENTRRLFKWRRAARRAPVLSKIVEGDELSPGVLGGTATGERSFV